MHEYFVNLIFEDTIFKDQVSVDGCTNVAEFKRSIKSQFKPILNTYASAQLTLFDGTTEIDPETLIDEWKTKRPNLYVKVVE